MKKRNLTYLGGLAALAVAVGVLGARMDVDGATDALADTQTMSSSCTAGTFGTFVPTLAYSVTQSAAPVVGSALLLTKAVTLTNGINGDAAPTVTVAAPVENYIRVHFNAPMMKASGLNCAADNASTLNVARTAVADSALLNIYFKGSTPTFAVGERADDSQTAKSIFGATGTAAVLSTGLKDYSDAAGQDGEVTFGGASNTINSQGGFKLGLEIQAYKNLWSAAVNENLTMTYANVTL